MEWKAPWITRRKGILAAWLGETGLAVAAFTLLYSRWFGVSPKVDLEVFGASVVWFLTSYISGRYQLESVEPTDSRYSRWLRIPARLAIVWLVSMITVVIFSWLDGDFQFGPKQPLFVTSYFITLAILSGAAECLARERAEKGFRIRTVLILSEEEYNACRKWIKRLDSMVKESCLVYMDDDPKVAQVLRKSTNVSCYVVGEGLSRSPKMRDIVVTAKSGGKKIVDIMDWMESRWGIVPLGLVCDRWLTSSQGFQISRHGTEGKVKRLGDIMVSCMLIVVTLPVCVVACAGIVMEDGHSPFYSQKRTGKGGKIITIWKLRTMRKDAEKNGVKWAEHSDSRVTRIGRFLRRTRIDELPQLINVLRGDLSLIGPRPERPELEVRIEKEVPYYSLRRCVRPGLSGWAQVCYKYGNSIEDTRAKLEYDLFYIQYGGLWLDLLIAVKTIRTVLGTGEYAGI